MILSAIVLAVTIGAPPLELDLSTPKKCALSFCASIQDQKWDQAAKCVDGGSVAKAKQMLDQFPKGGVMRMTLKDLTSETQAATASVTGNLYYSMTVPNQPRAETTYFEKLDLKLVGKNWLIVAAKPTPGMANTSPLAGMASIFAFGMPGTPAPRTGSTTTASPQTQTITNLKQMATAMMIYAADYDDLLPRADWQKTLQPYLKNNSVFKSPMSTAAKPSPYTFNPAMIGKNLGKVAEPAKTVLIYEGKNGVLAFLYAGKAPVAFADSHVKMVTKAEAAKLCWKP